MFDRRERAELSWDIGDLDLWSHLRASSQRWCASLIQYRDLEFPLSLTGPHGWQSALEGVGPVAAGRLGR
jgi:hypothetical protein